MSQTHRATPLLIAAALLSWTSAAFAQAVAQSYSMANLPTPTAGTLARVTDGPRGLWMAQGSQWFSVAGHVANVQDFGATCDGATTDDRQAIQDAIDSTAATSGGVVYVPPCSSFYRINAPLILNNVGVTIQGGGRTATRIKNYGNDDALYASGSGGAPNAQYFQIRDLTIESGIDAATRTAGHAIHIDGSSGLAKFVLLENVRTSEHIDGVRMAAFYMARFQQVWADNNEQAGFHIIGGSTSLKLDTTFASSNGGHGFHFDPGSGSSLAYVSLLSTGADLNGGAGYFFDASDGAIQSISMASPGGEGNVGHGIHMKGSQNSFNNSTIISPWISPPESGGTGCGIKLESTPPVVIIGGTVEGSSNGLCIVTPFLDQGAYVVATAFWSRDSNTANVNDPDLYSRLAVAHSDNTVADRVSHVLNDSEAGVADLIEINNRSTSSSASTAILFKNGSTTIGRIRADRSSSNLYLTTSNGGAIQTDDLSIGGGARIEKNLMGQSTWDPASIASGAITRTTMTVTGASPGDPCFATLETIGGNEVEVHCQVQAADTVRIWLINRETFAVDLSGGTARASVWKY